MRSDSPATCLRTVSRIRSSSSAPAEEERLSGFLLWQCAYSELYFCDTLWPDFGPEDMDRAIVAYQQRDRGSAG